MLSKKGGTCDTHLFSETLESVRFDRLLGDLVAFQAEVDDPILLGEFPQAEPAFEPAVAEVEDLESASAARLVLLLVARVGGRTSGRRRRRLAPGTEMRRERRQRPVIVQAEFVQVREGREIRQSWRGELVVGGRDLFQRGQGGEGAREGRERVVRDDCGRRIAV